jgi:hypothetical protein
MNQKIKEIIVGEDGQDKINLPVSPTSQSQLSYPRQVESSDISTIMDMEEDNLVEEVSIENPILITKHLVELEIAK